MDRQGRSGADTDTSIQGAEPYYAQGMSSAPSTSAAVAVIPDTTSTRQYIGAWSVLSVLQYFAAEAAVIGAWAGPRPYDLRTGYISDLGALHCGVFDGREVCSPLNWLMNASFVVQGLGMLLGALLLSSGLLRVAALAGTWVQRGRRRPWLAAVWVRLLTGTAGAGTVIVGLVPEDAGSGWHYSGALMYFIAGAAALLVLGFLWVRKTAMAWFILACGTVSAAALVTGGLTGMHVPEPGTLERLMAYPVTVGMATAGLVIAQRVHRHRKERARLRALAAR
ncbi:putative membrane protein [Arthrobacter sp. SLBN-100]|nr:putative membrane protein [Arthrobacter sp. SLBN-100]